MTCLGFSLLEAHLSFEALPRCPGEGLFLRAMRGSITRVAQSWRRRGAPTTSRGEVLTTRREERMQGRPQEQAVKDTITGLTGAVMALAGEVCQRDPELARSLAATLAHGQ